MALVKTLIFLLLLRCLEFCFPCYLLGLEFVFFLGRITVHAQGMSVFVAPVS